MDYGIVAVIVGVAFFGGAFVLLRKRNPSEAARVEAQAAEAANHLRGVVSDLVDKLHKSVPVTAQMLPVTHPLPPVTAPQAPITATGLITSVAEPAPAPAPAIAPVVPVAAEPVASPTGAVHPDGSPVLVLPSSPNDPAPSSVPSELVTMPKAQRDAILRNFDASVRAGRLDLAFYQLNGPEEIALQQRGLAEGGWTAAQIAYLVNLYNPGAGGGTAPADGATRSH